MYPIQISAKDYLCGRIGDAIPCKIPLKDAFQGDLFLCSERVRVFPTRSAFCLSGHFLDADAREGQFEGTQSTQLQAAVGLACVTKLDLEGVVALDHTVLVGAVVPPEVIPRRTGRT